MNVGPLCDDFLAEREDLLGLLEPLDEAAWATPTPAPGWSVLDQVTHLAWFDEACRQSVVAPDDFRLTREEALADVDGFVDRVTVAHRHLSGPAVAAWLRQTGDDLAGAARLVDGSTRVPWYGPDMSLASSITARIMETWAHGQDVADALHLERPPSPRLKHVAFLGARALANSYRARGLPVPEAPVRVELGDIAFGPEGAKNLVRGTLLDFCLVVTQRRHVGDTALAVEGPVATEWLSIAQAFAGPPGPGRTPGQFG